MSWTFMVEARKSVRFVSSWHGPPGDVGIAEILRIPHALLNGSQLVPGSVITANSAQREVEANVHYFPDPLGDAAKAAATEDTVL